MYQQYVTTARVGQYQQQCLREAALERSLRALRQTPSTTPARLGAWARMFFSTTWLRRLLTGPAANQ